MHGDQSIQHLLKQTWIWAGRIARVKDNRRTEQCTEQQPESGRGMGGGWVEGVGGGG